MKLGFYPGAPAPGFSRTKNRIMAKKTKKTPVEKTAKTLKVRFLISPTGLYNLGYHVGDVAEIEIELATKMIEAKHAELATEEAAKEETEE